MGKHATSPTHVKDLIADTDNRRTHTARNIGMVVDALHQVGAARSIVIDEHNVVLAGNGVTEAAAEAGITKVRVIDTTGDELIAVRRTGLTPEQKRALAIYDNRTAELATWDIAQLQADAAENLPLDPFFFEMELNTLLGRVNQTPDSVKDHWQGMPECANEDLTAWKTIKVHFASAENLQAFAALLQQPLTENTRSIWYPAAEINGYKDKRYLDT